MPIWGAITKVLPGEKDLKIVRLTIGEQRLVGVHIDEDEKSSTHSLTSLALIECFVQCHISRTITF